LAHREKRLAGDAVLAARDLQHALSMDPNNHRAHYLLGRAYLKLGKTAEADREFGLAAKLQNGPDIKQ
jgi:Flp pilus assembly protein TadD